MRDDDGFDVFLSYAGSDGLAAAELNNWLRDRGLRTFFDRSELRPGLRWISALEDAIGRSNAVAILVGSHGIGNTQQYERELALVRQTRDKDFPVIPVLLPGSEPADWLSATPDLDRPEPRCQRPSADGHTRSPAWGDSSTGDPVLAPPYARLPVPRTGALQGRRCGLFLRPRWCGPRSGL